MELNPKQQECVQHLNGPLLIVAGAGTGKTRVITNRILYLVQEKGIPTSQILALTFTEKAANEMTERVDIAMPFGYEEIWIKTFHGFCDKVLRDKGIEIGIDPNYKLLTKTQQWMFLKKHFYDFDFDYYSPAGNNAGFIHKLINHFSRLKDECISPAEYISYAEKKLKSAKDDLSQEEAKKDTEIARAYDKYQEMLRVENLMDFNDLILNTIELFKRRKTVLNHYQERFKHIMVDEFQDTNYAQTYLVLMLAEKYKNLVVVGDDDQSIYRWRGASLNNISMFKKAFEGAKFISITQNYRNNQDILDASHALIQNNNPERFEYKENISKKLEGVLSKSSSGSMEIWHFKHYLHEIKEVINYIQNYVKQDSASSFSDFAILGRTNNLLKPFIEELKSREIPYQSRISQNILSTDEVRDLIAVMRVILSREDNIAFFRILQMPVFNIEMKDIFNFINEANKTNEIYYEKIDGYGKAHKIEAFSQIYNLIEELVKKSRSFSSGSLLWEFFEKSGYSKFLSENYTVENVNKVKNISFFSRIVNNFEQENPENSIRSLLDYLELLEEEGINESGDFDIYESDDGVKVMTVHSAKGLEFKNLFIVNLVKQRFPLTGRSESIEIPDELIKEILPLGDHHKEEERRLMYVACTRAKEKLILTYSDKYEGNRNWEKSVFLNEISMNPKMKIQTKEFELDPKINISKTLREEKIYKPLTRPLAHLSYSQINTFTTCPLKYSYEYIIRLPKEPSPATSFGSSVHSVLRELYRMIKDNKKVSLEILEEIYNRNWVSFGYKSKAHENKKKKSGLEMLQKYFEKNSKPWIAPYAIEKEFSLKIGPYMIKGRIDRIDKLPNGKYEVIDYKTGVSRREANIDKDIQLAIYAMACKEIYGLEPEKLSWYFLENNEKKTRKDISDSAKTREEIINIIKNIETSDFRPKTGFHCKWCDYRIVCPAWE